MYQAYKGKRPGNKTVPVLIILCIVAAAVYFFLVRNLVYTQEGTALRLPFSDKTITIIKNPEKDEPVDLVIEVPDEEEAAPVSYKDRVEGSVLVTRDALVNGYDFQGLAERAKGTSINTVVIEVKADSGKLGFSSSQAIASNANASHTDNTKLTEAVTTLKNAGINVCAKISCFCDNTVPRTQFGMGISSNGNLYTDANGNTWLNPYSEQAQEYVEKIIGEICALGINEIILDSVAFPIKLGARNGVDMNQAIDSFISRAKTVAKEKGADISAVYYDVEENGQQIASFLQNFYRIYTPVKPSTTVRGVDMKEIEKMHYSIGENAKTRFVPQITLTGAESAEVIGDYTFTSKARGNGCMYINSNSVYPNGIFE